MNMHTYYNPHSMVNTDFVCVCVCVRVRVRHVVATSIISHQDH